MMRVCVKLTPLPVCSAGPPQLDIGKALQQVETASSQMGLPLEDVCRSIIAHGGDVQVLFAAAVTGQFARSISEIARLPSRCCTGPNQYMCHPSGRCQQVNPRCSASPA